MTCRLALVLCGLLVGCGIGSVENASTDGDGHTYTGDGDATNDDDDVGGDPSQGDSAPTNDDDDDVGPDDDITEPEGVQVLVTPHSVSLNTSGTRTFSCLVTQATNTNCTWSVTESDGGTVSNAGLYTAPATPGTYHVVATSVEDPSRSDSSTITVTTHMVGECDLAAAGDWQNVTPDQLNSQNWCVPGASNCTQANSTYGSLAFVLDRTHPGTMYLGTHSLGIWKTTNCGDDWVKVNTGTLGAEVGNGRNWSMLIDPVDPNTLYTVTGYAGPGVYKSTNGGKDWQQKIPASVLPNLPGEGVEKLAMDPENRLHITVSFHAPCYEQSQEVCTDNAYFGRSLDGGDTWDWVNAAAAWSEGDGQTMIDTNTWLFSSGGGNIWRTANAGGSWSLVKNGFSVGDYNTCGCVYVASDGAFYSGGSRGMTRSLVGAQQGIEWEGVPGAPAIGGPNGGCPMVSAGNRLFVSEGLWARVPANNDWFWYADLDNIGVWHTMNSPAVVTGAGWLDYDEAHNVLYASNSTGGFWRVVLP